MPMHDVRYISTRYFRFWLFMILHLWFWSSILVYSVSSEIFEVKLQS